MTNAQAYPDVLDLLDAGHFEQAERRLDELLRQERAAPLLLLLGRTLHNLSRHEEALAAHRQAAEDLSCRASALAGAGLALCSLKRPQEALQACDAALEHDPACAEALKNKAQALMRLGLVNEAHKAVAKALELEPEFAEAYVTMGLVRMLQMHAPDAESSLRHALRLNPNCASAHANLGFMYRRMNRQEEAVASLEEAVRLRPRDHVSLNNLALTYQESGRTREAEATLHGALELDPENVGYALNLAAMHRFHGRLDEAIELSRRVLEREPDNAQALTNVSSLLLQAGRLDAALESAENMVRLLPEAAVGHYNLGVVLLHLRRPKQAEVELLRALELGLENPDVYLAQAQGYQMESRFEEALEAGRKAMEMRADAKSHFTVAMALKSLGRAEDAAAHFRKSIEHDPKDSQGASVFLTALEGEEATSGLSEAYLERLFNQYAGTYDEHLTDRLAYRGPALLAQALEPHLSQGEKARILDLGCGTGLCAPALRPWAGELVGVDLSENMVRKARELGLYDRLERSEACAFLEGESETYDCIAAGDVLVYVGELSRLVAGVRDILAPGGVFAFTVEKQDEPGFSLGPNGRYRHGNTYIEGLAEENGLECCLLREDSVRSEAGVPVASWVVVLRKNGE